MPYNVKEIFYTLQGEGFHAGRPAVFCRFTSCNLWTGREEDRARAICTFCDTDFVGTNGPGGGRFRDAAALADAIDNPFVAESGMVRDVPHRGGRTLRVFANPLRIDGERLEQMAAPALNEDGPELRQAYAATAFQG